MPVTDLLERNHKLYGDEVALVELNPTMKDTRKTTWKEYDLVQQTSFVPYRREITWSVFDEKANRVANMLLSRGVQKGDRVAILMFNCLEWLPIYFGILKTGAIAVISVLPLMRLSTVQIWQKFMCFSLDRSLLVELKQLRKNLAKGVF